MKLDSVKLMSNQWQWPWLKVVRLIEHHTVRDRGTDRKLSAVIFSCFFLHMHAASKSHSNFRHLSMKLFTIICHLGTCLQSAGRQVRSLYNCQNVRLLVCWALSAVKGPSQLTRIGNFLGVSLFHIWESLSWNFKCQFYPAGWGIPGSPKPRLVLVNFRVMDFSSFTDSSIFLMQLAMLYDFQHSVTLTQVALSLTFQAVMKLQ